MNNDLISRSELKKVIETYRPIQITSDYLQGKNNMIDYCVAEIEGAPTVAESCKELHEVATERPQGEWGKHGECPFCSYIRQWEDDKFCGNCGAEMRGGAEK